MKHLVLVLVIVSFYSMVKGQNVAITDDVGYTADPSAMLDVKSTTKGLLAPRLTTTQRTSISHPATGLLVFDTDFGSFYFFNGTDWEKVGSNQVFSNSLTQTGNTIKWGGNLVENTTITQGNYGMIHNLSGTGNAIFNLSGTGDFDIQDNGVSSLFVGDNGNIGIGNVVPTSRLTVKGNTSGLIDDPLFEVKNNTGQTVFAVYNEGVRIYVNDDDKKATGSRGGFAVGGISSSKGITSEYLRITPDSVRVYVDPDAGKATGSRGGFAVGGISSSKGPAIDWMRLTNSNYFIGHESGVNTTGTYNLFFGYQSGKSNISGSNNVFIGYQSGYTNSSGQYNTFLGFNTGLNNNANFNSFIGYQAGKANTSGAYNSFLGYNAGLSNLGGSSNVFVGFQSGMANTAGENNVFLGVESGKNNQGGGNNVFLGTQSGFTNIAGNYNTFLGFNAGYTNNANYNTFIGYQTGKANTSGTFNSFMGYNAGKSNTTGVSNVFIGNECGQANIGGGSNVMIGDKAGFSNSSGNNNITIGQYAGYSLTTGAHNTFIGSSAGYNQTYESYSVMIGTTAGYNAVGSYNTFIGINASFKIRSSINNVFLGTNAGAMLEEGYGNTIIGIDAGRGGAWDPYDYHAGYVTSDNTIVGNNAGYNIDIGNSNTMIGTGAGSSLTNGSGNVFLGNYAGASETGSNKLHIGNQWGVTLIYGDFAANTLQFNGNVGIGKAAGYALDVAGDVNITGNYKVNGVNISSGASQWTTNGSNIYFNTGNVGIGTATPSQKLHVTGNGIFYNTFIGDVGHGVNYAAFAHNSSATIQGYALLQKSDGTATFLNKKSGAGYIGFRIDNVDKMVVDNSGYVGIGTITPTKLLDVNGDALVAGNITAGTVNATTFTGVVSGNVTGDLTGNVTGNVNGFTMGKIFMSASGIIVSNNTRFVLYWDSHGTLSIKNDVPKAAYNCWYWYQSQNGSNPPVGGSGIIEPGNQVDIPCSDGEGFEIHFADHLGNSVCSVWVQWAHGPLLGHYTLYGQDR